LSAYLLVLFAAIAWAPEAIVSNGGAVFKANHQATGGADLAGCAQLPANETAVLLKVSAAPAESALQ